MNRVNQVTVGELATLMGTGAAWSSIAGLAGFSNGTVMRRHCLRMGLKRKIRNGVVIVIAEPT